MVLIIKHTMKTVVSDNFESMIKCTVVWCKCYFCILRIPYTSSRVPSCLRGRANWQMDIGQLRLQEADFWELVTVKSTFWPGYPYHSQCKLIPGKCMHAYVARFSAPSAQQGIHYTYQFCATLTVYAYTLITKITGCTFVCTKDEWNVHVLTHRPCTIYVHLYCANCAAFHGVTKVVPKEVFKCFYFLYRIVSRTDASVINTNIHAV
jgi:hypothetical protein